MKLSGFQGKKSPVPAPRDTGSYLLDRREQDSASSYLIQLSNREEGETPGQTAQQRPEGGLHMERVCCPHVASESGKVSRAWK